MRRQVLPTIVVTAAALAALVPWSAAWVEQHYSRGWYPDLQRALTATSNTVPFAVIDLLLASAVLLVIRAAASVARAKRGGRWRRLGRVAWNGVAAGAALYLVFLGTWGWNYQRAPISASLDFDASRVTQEAVRALNQTAVAEMTRLRPALPPQASGWPARDQMARGLVPALDAGVAALGLPGPVRPGRPKTSVLDLYFTRAGVSGMTDPFFLETLAATNLLPFEEPMVVAHEWGHLAGLARESDASFFGWAVCLRGNEAAQYSAWFEGFLRTLPGLTREERRQVIATLPAVVRADIDATVERTRRDQVERLSLAAWTAYDSYLRANRVTSGVRNYSEVVQLMVGTRFTTGWKPMLRAPRGGSGGS
jgi:hypothetical protein